MNKPTLDGQLVNKFIEKYGYSLDMAIIYRDYDKVKMSELKAALSACLSHGLITITKQVDVEEYIANSYSSFMRRFVRVPRSLVDSTYGKMYEKTSAAHKALLADKPHAHQADNIGIQISAGHVDHDSLSNPWYIALYKIKLAPGITGVKVVGNSWVHKMIWRDFININILMSATLSKLYNNETLFARVISLSARSETIARYSQGKEKAMLTGKGALQDELRAVNLDVNKVMDISDLNISCLHIERELKLAKDSLKNFMDKVGIDKSKSLIPLIKYLEQTILPQVMEKDALPSFTTLYKFSQKFINDERDKSLPALVKDERESIAGTMAAILSSYLMKMRLISKEPDAEVAYYRMKKINLEENR